MKSPQRRFLDASGGTGLFLFSIFGLGCATIIHGDSQTVGIGSTPTGAKVRIYSRQGALIMEQTTPTTINLKRGSGYFSSANYRLVIARDGYQPSEFNIEGNLDGWYIGGNLIFGGLIGWLIVDPATGSMWTLSPDRVHANLAAKVSFLEQKEGLHIVLVEMIPKNLQHEMTPLNLPR